MVGKNPKTCLREWLPEEWRDQFVKGGVADVLVPAATMEHRVKTMSAAIVAHAALTTVMETLNVEPCSSMWVAIEKAQEVDLVSEKDLRALKALNREANACKHQPMCRSSTAAGSKKPRR